MFQTLSIIFVALIFLILKNDVHALSCHRSPVYEVKNGKVYYGSVLISDADPATLKPFRPYRKGNESSCPSYQAYAKDEKSVYFKGKKLSQADVESFQVIDEPGGVAQDRILFYCKFESRPRSGSVKELKHGHYKDQNSVCFVQKTRMVTSFLESRDAPTFEVFDSWPIVYSRDKSRVYCDDSVLSGGGSKTLTEADSGSFELYTTDRHSGITAKDKSKYFEGCKRSLFTP